MAGKQDGSRPRVTGGLPLILNECWPPDADQATDRDETVLVTARVVWRFAGLEYLRGEATRWTSGHIYVRIDDPRMETDGVWLRAEDVYRAMQ